MPTGMSPSHLLACPSAGGRGVCASLGPPRGRAQGIRCCELTCWVEGGRAWGPEMPGCLGLTSGGQVQNSSAGGRGVPPWRAQGLREPAHSAWGQKGL